MFLLILSILAAVIIRVSKDEQKEREATLFRRVEHSYVAAVSCCKRRSFLPSLFKFEPRVLLSIFFVCTKVRINLAPADWLVWYRRSWSKQHNPRTDWLFLLGQIDVRRMDGRNNFSYLESNYPFSKSIKGHASVGRNQKSYGQHFSVVIIINIYTKPTQSSRVPRCYLKLFPSVRKINVMSLTQEKITLKILLDSRDDDLPRTSPRATKDRIWLNVFLGTGLGALDIDGRKQTYLPGEIEGPCRLDSLG